MLVKEGIKQLIDLVGRPYEEENKDGTYQGCFFPFQFLYPDYPKFKMPDTDIKSACDFAFKKIKENLKQISPQDLEEGDIITTNFRGILHIAIYINSGKIIHVFKDNTLQIGRLKMFKNFQSFRVA